MSSQNRMTRTTPELTAFRRIVVKVGSSLLVDPAEASVKRTWLARLADDIARLHAAGADVLVVSSGAVALGRSVLGFPNGALPLEDSQAAAAVGQIALARIWAETLADRGLVAGQVLVTFGDTEERRRYLYARECLNRLMSLRAVPVINENDTVVTDEIKFGDNDTLGALVANLIEADCLLILTDQAGLYTADPRVDPQAQLLGQVSAGDPAIEGIAGGAGTPLGKGGMLTKVLAARRAASGGAHTVVASGREPGVLRRLMEGESLGTLFVADTPKLAARKQWIADQLQLRGSLLLDPGAVGAILRDGKSLLPVGVQAVQGEFARGDVVACLDANTREIARGLSNYAAWDARRIIGRASSDIESILGFMEEPELIHRSNLVLRA